MREVQRMVLPVADGQFDALLQRDAEIIRFALHFERPTIWFLSDPSKLLDVGTTMARFLIVCDSYAIDSRWNVYHGALMDERVGVRHLFQQSSIADAVRICATTTLYGGRVIKG